MANLNSISTTFKHGELSIVRGLYGSDKATFVNPLASGQNPAIHMFPGGIFEDNTKYPTITVAYHLLQPGLCAPMWHSQNYHV
ncbi:hypothetical protein BDV36DRAFT_243797 [Aspergillus pseudocaelatus]|uniref:Uncharacterized protein n=1 Tax=Aspergillus pseudocaelatus TaxID=1825620 RepID=A0ABQ6X1H8_9EURO|nr:hypothetical protein BDV36DRAFT_243797 [Aspergillus pseudocaelatus]